MVPDTLKVQFNNADAGEALVNSPWELGWSGVSDKKRVRRGEQITALRILKRRRRELQPTQLGAG